MERKLKDYNPEYRPVIYSLNKIGDRWKLLVIHYIRKGNLRFGALQNVIPNVSRQTLTNKLRELEADGIINRTVYAEVPPRVEYNLTELGVSLLPIINEMSKWGLKYMRP